MKKFEGMLMCTDLDGTLFQTDKTVSEENKEAIEYFKSEGGYFTFITGAFQATDRAEACRGNCENLCRIRGIYFTECYRKKRDYVTD